MAQPLSRPLVLSRSPPWPPAPPSPRFPNRPQPLPGSPSRTPFQSLPLAWPPSRPRPLFHPLSQIPVQALSHPHSQCLLKALAQPGSLLQSPSQPLLPSHSLPLFKPQCPAQPNPLSQPLPSSLCLPKSLPLVPPISHTLPLSQPRLKSGFQLPPALLLLLLFSVLGPGAGGLFLTDYSTCSPRKLSPFRSFASTELFHFHVPEDTFLAVWNLIIFKEQGGTFGDHCPDQSVTVYFRSGAPPVINPLHTHFPGDTAVPGVFSLTLSWTLPNRTSGIFNVSSPLPGDWFLAAHLPQAHGHISVKGLQDECQYLLQPQLIVRRLLDVAVLVPGRPSEQILSPHNRSALYKVFVPSFTYRVSAQLACVGGRGVSACPLSLRLRPKAPPLHNSSSVACGGASGCQLELALPPWGHWVYVRVETSSRGPGRTIRFQLCVRLQELRAPGKRDSVWMLDSRGALEPGGCSSDLFQRVPGRLPPLRQYHHQGGQAANPIPADGDLVPGPPLPVRGGASVSGVGPRFVRCRNATAEVRMRTFLSPCVDDCGPYGQCKLLRTHNYLYAACECKAGWRGWGCTDSADALTYGFQLLSTLLLCLSNLMFLPPVVLAIRSRYVLEAAVYTFTMFFSTFYHACDQPGIVVFCIMDYDVLQFCDFLGSLMSVWVTVIAMARLQPVVKQVLYLLGAMLLSMALQLDRHGLWNLLGPSLFALGILATAWYAASAAGTATHPHGAAGFSTCARAASLQAALSCFMLLWRPGTTTSTFTAFGICSLRAVWASCCPLVPRLTTGSRLEPGPGAVVTSYASTSRRSSVSWAQEGPLSAASVPAERGFGPGPGGM
ncbi:transmembrane protein 8B isoform X4 [Saimiri boliviensis]|uniref:transmembrane protein 8B isoform X4 n=1 Tax=Saimiri boliviensis TaxID=27679 RepID=UPI00193E1D27|nr:transmembrane protein 8B isoform X5 [Saimiri boliviensis boliviensis]